MGLTSSDGSIVRRFDAPPAAGIVKRSDCPSGRALKTSRWPSGAQLMRPTRGPPKEVSCTGFEPSASEIQISWVPDRVDEKAICFPSGEYRGIPSRRVEEIKRCGWLA